MSLIEKIVSSNINENKINKRLAEYSLKSNINKKPPISTKPSTPKNKNLSLLDKIVASSINENLANRRLADISYSAINGQRQEAKNYQPEGVQMLGQLDREKPLTAITKEMIKEFQEKEAAPIMVDGEARQYRPADYDPNLVSSPEEMETRYNRLNEWLKELQGERGIISNKIAAIDDKIKTTNESIISTKKGIDEKGSNFGNLYNLEKKKNELDKLKEERKQLDLSLDRVRYDISNYEDAMKRVRYDTTDREEIKKYEQALMQQNRNRLNLQQQPYESDYEYYKRLREIEKSKYNPILYEKYAANENTKTLKNNLESLFDDLSFRERIIKNIGDEDKFLINKNFNQIEKIYLDKFGFNNTRLNPKMTADELMKALNEVKGKAASNLQAVFQRNRQREIYADTVPLYRDRIDREERQAATQQAAQQAAAILRPFTQRNKQREIYADTIPLYRERIDREARKAATNIQKAFRGKLGRKAAAQAAQDVEQLARERAMYDREDLQLLAREAERQAAQRGVIRQEVADKYAEREERQLQLARRFPKTTAERTNNLNQQIVQARKNQQKLQEGISNLTQQREELLQFSPSFALQRQPLAFEARTGKKDLSMVGLKERQEEERKMIDKAEQERIQEIQKTRRAAPIIQRFFKKNKDKIQSKKAEILAQQAKAIPIIQQYLQNTKNKVELMNAVAKGIEKLEEQKSEKLKAEKARKARELLQQYTETSAFQKQPITPAATELSSAMTIAEQKEAGLRKVRSDLGAKRGPYKKKQEKELMKGLTPEERRMAQQQQEQMQTRAQALDAVLRKQQPGKTRTLDQIREELEDTQRAKGSGFGRRKQPKRRQAKTSQEDKQKNRLRLVASQIEAGNTNPRLVLEVNDLYEKLYGIKNAYMLLKK